MPMDEKEYRQHMIGDKIPIAKKDLVKGRNYIGRCRNADVALWTGKEFIYIRNKFGGSRRTSLPIKCISGWVYH